jgi:hypothetical protein
MTLRFRRRPDDWASPHERARALAAERIDQPIDAAEEGWLDNHLDACADCASIAAAYAAQRAELRSLRRRPPTPPRDLWARTAAAIEQEAAATSRGPRRARRRSHPSAIPLGALSGLLVIAVVIGASLLSRPTARPATITPTQIAVSLAPTGSLFVRPTPFDVAAANVGWMKLGQDGRIDVYDTPVQRVCPAGEGADCPPIDEPTPRSIQLADSPASVTRSPKDQGMVVVDAATKAAGGGVYVLPATNATAPPPASPSPTASAATSPSVAATASQPPSVAPQTPAATAQPTVTPRVQTSPVTTAPVAPSPPASPSAVPSSVASVRVTASPTTGTIEIARDVIVVGESEAYSPDGAWFAFSARPADNSHGPDIYAWRPGDAKATALTTDHRSVFSAWLGARILGSRGAVTAAPRILSPETFLVDPATGAQTVVTGSAAWRPSVDPQRHLAVYWDGSLELNEAGTEIRPLEGRLVLGTWTGVIDGTASPAPSDAAASSPSSSPSSSAAASPSVGSSATASPARAGTSPSATATIATEGVLSAKPSSSASPSPSVVRGRSIVAADLASGPVRDWDARWDETGTRLAVWIATEGDPRIGDLTLYSVDASSGRLQTLNRVAALAGFSIGRGRLAWATPKGQDGQGNRVQVVAWTKDSVGSVESRESTEVLVVIR